VAVAWAEVLAEVGVEDKKGRADPLMAEGTKEIADMLESKKKTRAKGEQQREMGWKDMSRQCLWRVGG